MSKGKLKKESNDYNELEDLTNKLFEIMINLKRKEASEIRENIYELLAKRQSEFLCECLDLQETLGCSLKVSIQALKQADFEGLLVDTVDNDGREWKGVYKVFLRYDSFNNKFYWCNGYFAVHLEDYKKTWWLKEDRSE